MRTKIQLCLVLLSLGLRPGLAAPSPSAANRFTYLDDFCDPYHPSHQFPKLTTPQWIGEPGVDAAVIFAIDDMSQYAAYEVYLRPLLERLKQIDGRAPASIMGNRINLAEPQLQAWLKEGVTLETHTTSHPCPILAGGNFAKAKNDYDQCVDHFFKVPNNHPVAFRTPCMDGMNSTGPRLFAEILAGTTTNGHFLTMSSSVGHVFNSSDPSLPADRLIDPAGKPRFTKYLANGFVNYVENYPYPYAVAGTIWELPFSVPDDYEGHVLQGSKHPQTLQDMQAALDLVVRAKGTYTQCFHPYPWIANTQMIAFVDHAVATHGPKVKFLNFREAQARLDAHLLAGQPLRATNGQPNGIRLLDLNQDGFMDVVIGNENLRQTRVWDPAARAWKDSPFPVPLVAVDARGRRADTGVRFGVVENNQPMMLLRNEHESGAWRFDGARWVPEPALLAGLELNGEPIHTARDGRDRGVRLHDIDGDGGCEVLVANDTQNAAFSWSGVDRAWKRLPYALPRGAAFVNARGQDHGVRFADLNGDGADDLLFSNDEAYGIHLMVPRRVLGFGPGWSREVLRGQSGQKPALPRIARAGDHPNNGAWFAQGEMRVQNEDTDKLPGLIERYSFAELLSGLQPPALSPAASLATLQVPTNFVVELVAAEPLVRDPVNMEWSADGRLWVVSMNDYPLGLDGHGQPGGEVRILEDTNGDGVCDKSTVFLNGLSYPNGVFPWKRGVLISAAPDILYAEDTDGDGKADKVEKLFTGFGQGNQQHRFNGFDYGLDQWLYGANGDSGGTVKSARTGQSVNVGGRDFRFRPDTGVLEVVSGHTQYGRHRDDWGNWFGNNNAVWLYHFWISEPYLKRNPRLAVESISRETATYTDAGRVYALGTKQQRMNDIGAAGHVTSANSPTPYRDDLFGETFANAVFISEPAQNLIRCERLAPQGASFSSTRLDPETPREFLSSSDAWFRPTGMKVGPDGALYVADMYRQFIEHPEWIPDDIKQRYNLRAGEDRGRIYRIRPRGAALRTPPRLDQLSPTELARAIDHPNGWQRDTIQRLLVQAGDKSVTAPLREVLARSPRAKARLSALATLDGLGALAPADLIRALQDSHAAVREHAIRISEPALRSKRPAELVDALLARATDDSLRVRFQLALSLGELDDPRAPQALARIALRDPDQRDIRTALMSSAAREPAGILSALHESGTDLSPLEPLTSHLVLLVAAGKSTDTIVSVIQRLTRPAIDGQSHAAWQIAAFAQLVAELEKAHRSLNEFPGATAALPPLLASARSLAQKADAPVPHRSAALNLLGRDGRSESEDVGVIASLLSPQVPDLLQQSALARLGQVRTEAVPLALLKGWPGFAPALRAQALEVLLRREAWVGVLLDRIESREFAAEDLGAGTRQRLLSHPNEALRRRATRALPQSINAERQQLVASYLQPVQNATGSAERGAVHFAKNCATCHRLRGQGSGAGPDLASVVDRSPERMLIAILDPNRAVEDRYLNYLAETKAGDELSGILAGETANSITLVGVSGARETILRADLRSLRSTRLSLMPEGFEQLLKPQDVADVLAYIEASALPPQAFPGNSPALIRPEQSGALHLRASNAEIYGDGIAFEATYSNLGSWNGQGARSVWSLDVPAGGSYDVWLHWACHDNEAGHSFRLQIGSQALIAKVPGTGTWDRYKHDRFGRIELPAGRQRAVFQAEGALKGYLIDLLEIRLVPSNAAQPPQFRQVGSDYTQLR